MWEVGAVPGRVGELVSWVLDRTDAVAQVYRSDEPDPRVVVIDPTGRPLPSPPPGLIARPPHSWLFEAVSR
ncbi:MAG: hypothetical protein JO147_07190 [Actinobacteria bacterium]|nr:hypothetical protein [Actinomycetota bacterium]